MPIYNYECKSCGYSFERIEKITSLSWKEVSKIRIRCPRCNQKKSKRIVESFKVGSKILETRNKSGYQTDELTLGKMIDEGGVPYEYKEDLRKRREIITRQNEYNKGLLERARKYKFDPFSEDES